MDAIGHILSGFYVQSDRGVNIYIIIPACRLLQLYIVRNLRTPIDDHMDTTANGTAYEL
jgi:hypothetical protein